MEIFNVSLQDDNIEIKVSSMNAICKFLGNIVDSKVTLKYKKMVGNLLEVVTKVLQVDEKQGRNALGGLIELALMHG